LASTLGCHVYEDANTITLWRNIQDRLATLRYQRIPTVVLFDDADECEAGVLTTLCRLTQMEQQPDSRLSIVLACNVSGRQLLGERLLELSELPVELDPFDEAEAADYVNIGLARVGRIKKTFTDEALHAIHQYTHGVPRAINQLTELCLVGGAAERAEIIDADLVEAARETFYGTGVGAVARGDIVIM
jgi:general secretion pathway protein A